MRLAGASAASHLCSPPQQVNLLAVRSAQHFHQSFVRWIRGECTTCFENRRIDYSQTFLELHDRFRCELVLLTLQYLSKPICCSDVIVLERRKLRERLWPRPRRRIKRSDSRFLMCSLHPRSHQGCCDNG